MSESDEELLIERIARRILQTGLVAPAILLLEIHRPLSFLASQGMHLMAPFATMVFSGEDYRLLAKILERRDGIERLLRGVEQLDRKRRGAA